MTKKIAVLGTGKTGGEVLRMLQAHSGFAPMALNRTQPPTPELWASIDAAVCFLPGPAFLEYLPIFLQNPRPMVIGSTGYELTGDQQKAIAELPCSWVMSSNFSLGMSLAKLVIETMARWADASPLAIAQGIEEVHHVHKKDAPSGTALLWKRWIEESSTSAPAVNIKSQRVQDLYGTHEYTLKLPQETMSFKHDATSRSVFAEGAVWALEEILNHPPGPGRIDFFALIAASMKRGS